MLPLNIPIEPYKEEIQKKVMDNRTTVIIGETGSGKTSRVPPYLLEAGLNQNGLIGVTQPRRIAAISTAEYVAMGIGCKVGEEVGFQIRFLDSTTEGTKIKFMTDGILLQEAKSDALFSRYDVLVFDEAHERGLNTDFALGLAKRALGLRDDLRIVVMSATLETEKFSAFFNNAPIIRIEGRMYPVETHYIKPDDITSALDLFQPKPGQDIEALAAYIVDKICRTSSRGDILVFMPGETMIHHTISFIEKLEHGGLTILPAYGNMNPEEQRRIFDRTIGRKIVVATNIAETGLTIDGIVYVVDSGLIRESNVDPATGIGSLKVVEHSKAGLEHRKGRAGRTQPGVCWRLFLEENYEKTRHEYRREWNEERRPEYTTPEIQRSDLAGVVLRLIGLGIKEVETFEFIDAPSEDMLHGAVETLRAIGALTSDREITEIGQRTLDLPLDPKIGRMIIAAKDFGCLKEVKTIAAKLSVRDFHLRPKDKEEEADRARMKFIDRRSDLLTALAVIKAYQENGRDHRWARENFLNWKAIEEALAIDNQLQDILERLGIEITSVGYHLPESHFSWTDEEKRQGEMIGKAVAAGLIQNLAMSGYRHSYQRLAQDSLDPIYIHPSSVLFGNTPELIVSSTVVETTKAFARNCQGVAIDWLEEIAPQAVKKERSGLQKRFLSGDYVFYERTLFNGRIIKEQELPAWGPEVTRQLAQDIVSGRQDLFCRDHNRNVLSRVERAHIASGEKTKAPLTDEELEGFYFKKLEGAENAKEAAAKNLLLDIRDFISEEEEEKYLPKIAPSPHRIVSPLSGTPDFLRQDHPATHEIDWGTQQRLDGLKEKVEEMVSNPSLYGYEGGWGIRRKTYQLYVRLDDVTAAFRRGDHEEGEKLFSLLSKEMEQAYDFRKKREIRIASKRAREEEAEKKQKEYEAAIQAWLEYKKRVEELKEKYKGYPGLGIYTFPIGKDGLPQEYRGEDGRVYKLDEDFFEILPEEKTPCWGYVTQWGNPSKVALLMKVVPEPKKEEK